MQEIHSLESLRVLPVEKICQKDSFCLYFYIKHPPALLTVSSIAHGPFTERMEEFTGRETRATAGT